MRLHRAEHFSGSLLEGFAPKEESIPGFGVLMAGGGRGTGERAIKCCFPGGADSNQLPFLGELGGGGVVRVRASRGKCYSVLIPLY